MGHFSFISLFACIPFRSLLGTGCFFCTMTRMLTAALRLIAMATKRTGLSRRHVLARQQQKILMAMVLATTKYVARGLCARLPVCPCARVPCLCRCLSCV